MQEERPLKRLMNICFERDREFWVSHEHRLIFLSIPKNANSYLRSVFINNHHRAVSYDPARESVISYHRRAGKRGMALAGRHVAAFEDYQHVVALRDPFARLVSAYLDKIVKPIIDPARHGPDSRYWRQVSRRTRHPVDEASVTFRRFAAHALATPDTQRNRHCRSQHHYLGAHRFTFYGDIADMTSLLNQFQRCGLDTRLSLSAAHKRTRYGDFAKPGPHAAHLADWPPAALGALDSFPSAPAFYDPPLCHQVAAGYGADVDLYARHARRCPHGLVAAYGTD